MELINDISTLVDKHGIFEAAVIVVLMILIVATGSWCMRFQAYRFLPGALDKLKGLLGDQGNLTVSASLFQTKCDNLLRNKIPNLSIVCPLRKEVFTRILEIRVKTYKRGIAQLMNEGIDKMRDRLFRTAWETFFDEADAAFVQTCLNDGVPRMAVDAYNDIVRGADELMDSFVATVMNSNMIMKSNMDKTLFVLDVALPLVLGNALMAVERTLDAVNGELSKMEYRGASCANCPECEYGAHPKDDTHNKEEQ